MQSIQDIEKLPIAFIIGRGRSGTTLLQTIMDANSSVITANESSFIIHLKQKYFKIKIWDVKTLDDFIYDLYQDKKFAILWGIDEATLKKQISLYDTKTLNFNILCKLIYLSIQSPFQKNKISVIIDKNPIYSYFIKELSEIFPNAKFIHLIRDYRDNVISSRKAFKINNVALLAQRWKRLNMKIDSYKLSNPKKIYTLQYESLVTQPEKTILELCSFIGIEFNQDMLNFHKTTSKIYSDDASNNNLMKDFVTNIHSNLLKPINAEQINKWEKELLNQELEVIDYIAGTYAEKYNYHRTTHINKLVYKLTAIRTYLIYFVDFIIYKTYYNIPMAIRNLSKKLSKKLYNKFGYINRHNKIDILYKKD